MQPTPVEFHPAAVREAAAARRWYAEIRPELGEAFAAELDRTINRMGTAPKRGPQHLHGTRCLLLHRFPYLVVYRSRADRVQVVAVQHTSRKPGYWKSRVDQ